MNKTLVIIPTYNEMENIVKLIDTLLLLPLSVNVLVVDDSKDETATLVKNRQANEPRLFLIKRNEKGGRGTAVLDGFKFALSKDYNRIVEMDADFSHDPKELISLLDVSRDDNVVIGSRYLKNSKIINWPLRRRIFSKSANLYAGCILRIGIHDYTNGYRVYSRQAVQKIDFTKIKSSGYVVLSEIAYQLFKKGLKFVEVPTVFVNRRRGVSNFSLKEIKEAFVSVVRIKMEGV